MRLGLRPQCNRGREEHLELSITYGSLKYTGDGSIIIRAWQGPQAHPQYNIPYVNSVVSKVFRHDGEQDLHFLQLRLINALSSKGFVDAKAGRKRRQLQLTTNCLIALLIQLSQNRPPRKGRYHQTQVYTQETVLPPQTLKDVVALPRNSKSRKQDSLFLRKDRDSHREIGETIRVG